MQPFYGYTSSIEDIFPIKKDSDSGVGSDSGEKRLSALEVPVSSLLPFFFYAINCYIYYVMVFFDQIFFHIL